VNSEIPVLVSATAEAPIAAQAQAVAIIRDEHRSVAAVLHAWQHLFKSAPAGSRPDATLMQAMVGYIRDFQVALHHPKEDEYLFRLLRERTPAANAELDELGRQHARAEKQVNDLSALVERYAAGGATVEEIEGGLARYTQDLWEHMGREEGVILPLAQRHLTEADWVAINDAFSQNGDPRFGGDTGEEFKRLFSRIVNLAPSST
jgi:hemerythrin-like domain-containing protein